VDPNKLRLHVLDMVFSKKSGHIGGSFSLAEIIADLYSRFDLTNTDKLKGDKLILSKGHAAPILYAAHLELGLFPYDTILSFRELESTFQGHPDSRFNRFVHASTGSLGQGLSIACGIALSKKLNNDPSKVFCILGDGELNEGQIYEALMFINKYNLSNLITIIDSNGYQNDGSTSTIMPIFSFSRVVQGFGLCIRKIDGNNSEEIAKEDFSTAIPTVYILNTVKGCGVDFMEGKDWHSRVPNQEEYQLAKEQLLSKIKSTPNE